MRIVALVALMCSFSMASWASPSDPAPDHLSAGSLEVSTRVVETERFIARVYYEELDRIRDLERFDVLEFRDRDEEFVLVQVDRDQFLEILGLGFQAEMDLKRTETILAPDVDRTRGVSGIPGFPCYRTVEETFAFGAGLEASHPNLATWVDAGDSWEKTAALGGFDLHVLKLTNNALPGPKPALVATCSIHAREYAPAELCNRFAETLVNGYGVDPDITWVLDHREVHLMLHTNPDGRKQAETGLSWRKNTNQNFCSPTSNNRGIDLNRNFTYEWGCCSGSSSSECDLTFRGPSPGSEPETQAVMAYVRSVFPDQRGELLTDAAPDTAEGVYIDVHSFSELVLWPWGWGTTVAPNGVEMQTLGRKLASYNGYFPEQAIGLYATDGTTDDFVYGDLGVASYTFELGTSFFQDCSTFENTILPTNLGALLYAAKVADLPYITPSGPDVTASSAAPALADPGSMIELRADLDDSRFDGQNGTEPVQSIASAEVWIDEYPGSGSGTPLSMIASDGLFDSSAESVQAALDVTGLSGGRHVAFVRGSDADANLGAVTAFEFWVKDGTEGAVAGVVTETGTGAPLSAQVQVPTLSLSSTTDPGTGAYSVELPAGDWVLRFLAADHLPSAEIQVTVVSAATTPLDVSLDPVPAILLVDDDDNSPDLRAFHTDALDALGLDYYVWDTADSDNEPDSAFLASFDKVIWFTGDSFGGNAGPGGAGETALGGWLDSGGCLLLGSQDYYYDRGLTGFMQQYLGLASAVSDVGQTTATGTGSLYGGFGPYTLSYPYTNYSDSFTAGAGGEIAFVGSSGDAAVSRVTATQLTSFWSFGLEAVPTQADREALLTRFFEVCDPLLVQDADSDGVADPDDCSPNDGTVWSVPTEAKALRLGDPGLEAIAWQPPSSPGGTAIVYDVVRSGVAGDFSAGVCVDGDLISTSASDVASPAAGEAWYYLVSAQNPCGEAVGAATGGQRVSMLACP